MQGRSLPSGERESRKVGSATGKAPPQSWTGEVGRDAGRGLIRRVMTSIGRSQVRASAD
jgi:hypothetical protein